MKKPFLLFLLLLGCGIAPAQVSYGYDAAGNRISRTITLARNALVTNTDSVPPATEMLGELQVKIYPNPTKGQLSVEVAGLPDGTTGTVGIFTLQGGLVLQGAVSSLRTNLDISGQPAGTYVMKITVGEKKTTWKIIKE